MPSCFQFVKKSRTAAEPHPFAEVIKVRPACGDGMRLYVIHLLQPVFQSPEKNIVADKMQKVTVAYEPLLQKAVKRTKSVFLSKQYLFPAVNKLKYLYKKFYLPYAAITSFYVPAESK